MVDVNTKQGHLKNDLKAFLKKIYEKSISRYENLNLKNNSTLMLA